MAKSDKWCPLIQKDCKEHKCSWYTHIQGVHPQTGENMDKWGCAVEWVPMLLVENSSKQLSTAAAIESFRNEVVTSNHQNQQLYVHALEQGVDVARVTPIDPPMIGPPINLHSSYKQS